MPYISVTYENVATWSPPGGALCEAAANGALVDVNVLNVVGDSGLLQGPIATILAEAVDCAPPDVTRLSFLEVSPQGRLAAMAAQTVEHRRRCLRVLCDIPESPERLRHILPMLAHQFVLLESDEALPAGLATAVHLRPLNRAETHEAIKSHGKGAKYDPALRDEIYAVTGGAPERVIDIIGRTCQLTRGAIMNAIDGHDDRKKVQVFYDAITSTETTLVEVSEVIAQAFDKLTWRTIARHMPDVAADEVLSLGAEIVTLGLHDILTLPWRTKADTVYAVYTIAERVRRIKPT